MLKVGQKVVFTEKSQHTPVTRGKIIRVDEDDYEDGMPYLVEIYDEDDNLETEWCYAEEVKAYGEVIE